jgi:hypothetical protein
MDRNGRHRTYSMVAEEGRLRSHTPQALPGDASDELLLQSDAF